MLISQQITSLLQFVKYFNKIVHLLLLEPYNIINYNYISYVMNAACSISTNTNIQVQTKLEFISCWLRIYVERLISDHITMQSACDNKRIYRVFGRVNTQRPTIASSYWIAFVSLVSKQTRVNRRPSVVSRYVQLDCCPSGPLRCI